MRFVRQNIFTYALIIAAISAATVLFANVYITTASLSEPYGSHTTVIIDPGHGGEDGGAVSVHGIKESALNLQIAHRTDDLLHLLGVSTIMTRTEDISVHSADAVTIAEKKVSDLQNRVTLVNGTEAALLLSIHQNMFPESKYKGAQVFYSGRAESRLLAESMQRTLINALDRDNRRAAKPAEAIYLMEHVQCPAVLVECGFLSNPDECRLLCTQEYQKKLAIVLTADITDYLERVTTNEI